MPEISILIATIDTRKHFLKRLLDCLEPQLTDDVELHVYEDSGECCVGEKRNALLRAATGEYTCFIDDDDWVSPDYVALLLQAAKARPDVITFKLDRFVNDMLIGHQTMRLAHNYDVRDGVWKYPPTHLCPIRRQLSQQIAFPWCNAGEDCYWQDLVKPLLKTEVHVDAVLYRYLLRTDRRGEITNAILAYDDNELERRVDAELCRLMAFPHY